VSGIEIAPSGESCGAFVTGLDLREPLTGPALGEVRQAFNEHHVLVFPEQALGDEDLVRFGASFGPLGPDPFFRPIDDHGHIAAIQRGADETGPIFAESWHSDWSFLPTPPAATCLFGITIPPVGGDTLFSNQHLALERMPAELRSRLEGRSFMHSARRAYSPEGLYGDPKNQGSMAIEISDEAYDVHIHPAIRTHPESGLPGLFGGSYVVGVEGLYEPDAGELARELYAWQARVEFQYRHHWQENMLVMWDNRSILHMATGGYAGHDRLLHRITIADDPTCYGSSR
jgi:taurine dioxygenase